MVYKEFQDSSSFKNFDKFDMPQQKSCITKSILIKSWLPLVKQIQKIKDFKNSMSLIFGKNMKWISPNEIVLIEI